MDKSKQMVECLPERLEDRQILGVAEKRNKDFLAQRDKRKGAKRGMS